MRHALIPIHLVQEARAAAAGPARQVADAPPDPQPATEARPRRLATLFTRARGRAEARAHAHAGTRGLDTGPARGRSRELGTESPGGGA